MLWWGVIGVDNGVVVRREHDEVGFPPVGLHEIPYMARSAFPSDVAEILMRCIGIFDIINGDEVVVEWVGDSEFVIFSREFYESIDWHLVPWELEPVGRTSDAVVLRRVDREELCG